MRPVNAANPVTRGGSGVGSAGGGGDRDVPDPGEAGAGKTYTVAVMMEEMMTAGLPVVVIDPGGRGGGCAPAPIVGQMGCRW